MKTSELQTMMVYSKRRWKIQETVQTYKHNLTTSTDHINCTVIHRAENLLKPFIIELQELTISFDLYDSITKDWFTQQITQVVQVIEDIRGIQ